MTAYQIVNLPAGHELVLEADESSFGYYHIYPVQLGQIIEIGPAETVSLGPFSQDRQYRVFSEEGQINVTLVTAEGIIVGTVFEVTQAGEIGFFGVEPVNQRTDPGPLTNNLSDILTDNILQDVLRMDGTADGSATERNFSELNNKINGLRQALLDLGLLG